jgi:hypothetical protein
MKNALIEKIDTESEVINTPDKAPTSEDVSMFIKEHGTDITKLNDRVESVNEAKFIKNKGQVNKSNVDHPSHYAEGRQYEPIDVIEDWDLGFHVGNSLKYISRLGRKKEDGKTEIEKTLEDIDKAIWYLNRYKKQLKTKAGMKLYGE